MSEPLTFHGRFERMVPVAGSIAKQVADKTEAAGQGDVGCRDLCDLAAHLLTIAVDAAGKAGKSAEACARFRDTFRSAVAFEKLPGEYLDAIYGQSGLPLEGDVQIPEKVYAEIERAILGDPDEIGSVRTCIHLAYGEGWAACRDAAERRLDTVDHARREGQAAGHAEAAEWIEGKEGMGGDCPKWNAQVGCQHEASGDCCAEIIRARAAEARKEGT